jgi:hypothetical protein
MRSVRLLEVIVWVVLDRSSAAVPPVSHLVAGTGCARGRHRRRLSRRTARAGRPAEDLSVRCPFEDRWQRRKLWSGAEPADAGRGVHGPSECARGWNEHPDDPDRNLPAISSLPPREAEALAFPRPRASPGRRARYPAWRERNCPALPRRMHPDRVVATRQVCLFARVVSVRLGTSVPARGLERELVMRCPQARTRCRERRGPRDLSRSRIALKVERLSPCVPSLGFTMKRKPDHKRPAVLLSAFLS